MDVILRVVGNVVIEDVADGRDVEAARRDVAGDQDRHLAGAEAVEGRHARVLVHVAVQGGGGEAVPLQRPVQDRHVALAVAEDDRVLQVRRAADQVAQGLALLEVLAVPWRRAAE